MLMACPVAECDWRHELARVEDAYPSAGNVEAAIRAAVALDNRAARAHLASHDRGELPAEIVEKLYALD